MHPYSYQSRDPHDYPSMFVPPDTNRIYTSSSDEGLCCLDVSTGDITTHISMPARIPPCNPPFFVGSQYVYVGGQKSFFALPLPNTSQQATMWKFRTPSPLTAPPTANNDSVYIPTRQRVYKCTNEAGPEWAFKASNHDRVFISTSAALGSSDVCLATSSGTIYSIDKERGALNWTSSLEGYPTRIRAGVGRVYVKAREEGSGRPILHSVDSKTGHFRWQTTINDIWSPISLSTEYEHVYTLSGPKTLASAGIERLLPQWSRTFDAKITGPPRYLNDTVYIGTADGQLHALEAETGNTNWSVELPTKPITQPTISNDSIYVTGIVGHISAIHTTGKKLWDCAHTAIK